MRRRSGWLPWLRRFLQYRRVKGRVRRGSIGTRSHMGVERIEEGEIGGNGGPGSGEERRRRGHWHGPEAEREGCSWWGRGERRAGPTDGRRHDRGREREMREAGCVSRPGEKRKMGRSRRNKRILFIYSNRIQTSLNGFDQKVDLPRSKNSK
jgi:hypothetical protein